MPSIRTASATRRTANRLVKLIAEFKLRDMTLSDIGACLELSLAEARAYRIALVAENLIIAIDNESGGTRYTLTEDTAAVAAFLTAQNLKFARSTKSAATPPGLHVMHDDMRFTVNILRTLPKHTELHAYFFGKATPNENTLLS